VEGTEWKGQSGPTDTGYSFVANLTTFSLSILSSDGRMTDAFGRLWKEPVMAYARYYPRILLEGIINFQSS
jgi:hypothetical protein